MQRQSRLIGGVYQVGQVITTGSFLTMYTAYNRNTSDVVGLLVIDLPPTLEPSTALQFLSSLTRRRQIQSPHVIRVYDWGVSEGKAYIATVPPRGITLKQLTDNENISLAQALELSIQMARGIAALQSNGIIDTDLRPQLITIDTVVQDNRVQLDDVGLRALFRQLGYVQGQNTPDIGYFDPRYMAPESIYQGVISPASDVYQLGLVLFELLTGRPPFVGRTPAETGIMQSNGQVPNMTQLKHNTPPVLQEIVERALAKNPQQRYPHATAFLEALEKVPQFQKKTPSDEWQFTPARETPASELLTAGEIADHTSEMSSLSSNVSVDAADTLVNGERSVRRPNQSDSLMAEQGFPIYAYLDFEQEGQPTRSLAISDTYAIIGRVDPKRGITPEIDLTSIDPHATVSRQHARIRFAGTFFYIEDLKSRNKTRLGQLVLTPLKPELIQHADVVYFGSVRLVFRVPGTRTTPPPKNLPT